MSIFLDTVHNAKLTLFYNDSDSDFHLRRDFFYKQCIERSLKNYNHLYIPVDRFNGILDHSDRCIRESEFAEVCTRFENSKDRFEYMEAYFNGIPDTLSNKLEGKIHTLLCGLDSLCLQDPFINSEIIDDIEQAFGGQITSILNTLSFRDFKTQHVYFIGEDHMHLISIALYMLFIKHQLIQDHFMVYELPEMHLSSFQQEALAKSLIQVNNLGIPLFIITQSQDFCSFFKGIKVNEFYRNRSY